MRQGTSAWKASGLRECIDESNANGSSHRRSGKSSADPGIDCGSGFSATCQLDVHVKGSSSSKLTDDERSIRAGHQEQADIAGCQNLRADSNDETDNAHDQRPNAMPVTFTRLVRVSSVEESHNLYVNR